MASLLIFDTHPIQYRSPVFGALAEKKPGLKVVFFNSQFDSHKWWFHEVGKNPPQKWGLPLLTGFDHSVMETHQLGLVGKMRALSRILDAEQPSQVALYGYYMVEHWMLRVLCALKGIPLIFVGETYVDGKPSLRRTLKKPLRSWFFRGVWRFVAIGRKTAEYYRAMGIEPRRIVPAKYCVDLSFFQQTEARSARTAWRKKLGLSEEAFVVLFVGRLFERKRPGDLLKVQSALAKLPDLYTVVVGNGPMEEALKAEGAQIPRLVFMGFQDQAAARDAYYGADVLFVPSEYETWGLVVNEAAACGLPSVLTDTCGVADDLVVHGETGFVFPRADVAQATQLLAQLHDDRTLCRSLGQNAKHKVESEYGIGQFADAFANLATV